MRPDADDDRGALTAFRDAAAYERGRPAWPPDAVDALCEELGVDDASTVVDLGAGTGKLTRLLVARAGHVVAVEPSAPMLEVLRREVPAADAVRGAADELPLGDGEAQAVFVAEAYHWFGSEAVAAELARVVAPGGGLALLWNRPERWPEIRALEAVEGTRPRFPYGDDRWRSGVERSFGPIHEAAFGHEQRLDRDAFVAQVASFSWMQRRRDRDRILARVLAETPAEVVIRYRTAVFWAFRP